MLPLCIYSTFSLVSRFLGISFLFYYCYFCFHLHFSLGSFLLAYFKLTESFHDHVQPTSEPIKGVCLFFLMYGYLQFPMNFSLKVSIPLITSPISSCMLSTFSTRALSILIIVILNTCCDNSKLRVIIESGSIVCVGSSYDVLSCLYMPWGFLLQVTYCVLYLWDWGWQCEGLFLSD